MAVYARPPFESWPVHLYEPSLEMFVWFAKPAVIVSQLAQPTATLEHARLLGAAIDRVLIEHAREVDMHAGLLAIHDWRAIEEFSAGARQHYSQRLEKYKPGQLRGAYVASSANPLAATILKLGAMAMPFRTGQRVRLVSDPLPLLAEHGVVPLFDAHPFRRTLFPSLIPPRPV